MAAIVGLLVALSVASERLVEIVKGLIPALAHQADTENKEGFRKAGIQVLGVAAGIVTAFMARSAIPQDIFPSVSTTTVLALGLLASGGSGFWNTILAYLLQVKNMKKALAEEKQLSTSALKASLARSGQTVTVKG